MTASSGRRLWPTKERFCLHVQAASDDQAHSVTEEPGGGGGGGDGSWKWDLTQLQALAHMCKVWLHVGAASADRANCPKGKKEEVGGGGKGVRAGQSLQSPWDDSLVPAERNGAPGLTRSLAL